MYRSLVEILFTKRRNLEYTEETMQVLGKMLRLNPDFYSLWNFRREILLKLHPEIEQGTGVKSQKADISRCELEVAAEGIRKNPKSCKDCYVLENKVIFLIRLRMASSFVGD